MRCYGSVILFSFVLFLSPGISTAAVTGLCSNCHTMHNSQAGTFMADSATPRPTLLNDSCVGCHTGTNNGVNTTPYILDSGAIYGATGTESTTTTLAGGNFAWVAANHRAGHNVSGVPGVALDVPLGVTPPGFNAASSPRAAAPTVQLKCSGTNGCHGDYAVTDELSSIKGSHHDGVSGLTDGSDLPHSYRLLMGIAGLEDGDWEYRPTATAHNQYKGEARTKGSDIVGTNTISYLCAECHSDFHNGVGTASGLFWIRHPTDFDMTGLGGEYVNYNGDGSTYSVISPVASASVASVISTGVLTGGGKAIVMCLSCHRAHGTPNDAILRWDYKGWPAAGYNGCAVCHSTKN